ncbi:MAG TPA: hypothetical protein VGS80_01090 [Ktedonobacterales bacterium]|nr:hypothetical protein [Ktedonobacterales bacterium]
MKLLALPVRATDRLVAHVLLCALLRVVGAADASGADTGHPRIRSTIGNCEAAPTVLLPCVPRRGGAPLPAADCGVAGTLIGVVVPRALFNVGYFGFVASLLLTIASAIMATVIGLVALPLRRQVSNAER